MVEELLQRGIVVSYETIRCWPMKFGPHYAGRLRRKAPSPNDVWHLDEVVVTNYGWEFSAPLRSFNPTISIMGSDGEGRKPTAS